MTPMEETLAGIILDLDEQLERQRCHAFELGIEEGRRQEAEVAADREMDRWHGYLPDAPTVS